MKTCELLELCWTKIQYRKNSNFKGTESSTSNHKFRERIKK